MSDRWLGRVLTIMFVFGLIFTLQAAHIARYGEGLCVDEIFEYPAGVGWPTNAVEGDMLRLDSGGDWVATSGYVLNSITNAWSYTNLICDGSSRDLDLSTNNIGEALVPAGAKGVNIFAELRDDTLASYLVFYTKTSGILNIMLQTVVATQSSRDTGCIGLDSNRLIKYTGSSTATNATYSRMKVLGWQF